MKIIVIGATGIIGSAIVSELKKRHEVIAASTQGDIKVDITKPESIKAMFEKVTNVDAVVLATGKVCFREFAEMTPADYEFGLKDKLMGQVNVVLIGKDYINDDGSFTLTSGILNREPIRTGSSAAMVNGALEGFVKSVAIEMPRGIRINCVSPTIIQETTQHYASYLQGFEPVSALYAALTYSKSVENHHTGHIYCVD